MIELVKDKHYNLEDIEKKLFSRGNEQEGECIVIFPNQYLIKFRRMLIPWNPSGLMIYVEATIYHLILTSDLNHEFWISEYLKIEENELEQFLETVSSCERCFPDKLFTENELKKIWEETRIKPDSNKGKPKTLKERFGRLFNFIEI